MTMRLKHSIILNYQRSICMIVVSIWVKKSLRGTINNSQSLNWFTNQAKVGIWYRKLCCYWGIPIAHALTNRYYLAIWHLWFLGFPTVIMPALSKESSGILLLRLSVRSSVPKKSLSLELRLHFKDLRNDTLGSHWACLVDAQKGFKTFILSPGVK